MHSNSKPRQSRYRKRHENISKHIKTQLLEEGKPFWNSRLIKIQSSYKLFEFTYRNINVPDEKNDIEVAESQQYHPCPLREMGLDCSNFIDLLCKKPAGVWEY